MKSTPKPNKPPPPPTMPDEEEVKKARRRSAASQMDRSGRASTILSDAYSSMTGTADRLGG